MKVKINELKQLAHKIIKNYGYADKETKTILEVLMYAQLRGNNQGLVKLIGHGLPKNEQTSKIKTLKQTKLSALLDGGQNQGMIVMQQAIEIALEKAKKHGFGIVGIKNTASSTGAVGYYVKQIAKKGYIGFVFPSSPCAVCHYGSYQPMYGTNPIAVGFPAEGEPVVLDMATSAMAWFGLVEAKTAGQKVPNDVGYNPKGKATVNPAKIMEGAIRPFDRNYKGAGLAMMVEILGGPLVQAGFAGINTENGWGNLVMVIDPNLLTTRKTFKQQVTQLVQKVKRSKKLPGVKEVFMPGERGNKLTRQRLKSGWIEIENNLYQELKKAAEK